MIQQSIFRHLLFLYIFFVSFLHIYNYGRFPSFLGVKLDMLHGTHEKGTSPMQIV